MFLKKSNKDKINLRLPSAALRIPTGALILNSGLGKFQVDKEGAEGLRDMATDGIPQLGQIDAETFATGLASAETALGAALLCPLIPNRLAGLGLTAFGAGLLTMYSVSYTHLTLPTTLHECRSRWSPYH